MSGSKTLTRRRFVVGSLAVGLIVPVLFTGLGMFMRAIFGHDLSLEARLDEIMFVFWPTCLWLLATYGGTKRGLFLVFAMSTIANGVVYAIFGLGIYWLWSEVKRLRAQD